MLALVLVEFQYSDRLSGSDSASTPVVPPASAQFPKIVWLNFLSKFSCPASRRITFISKLKVWTIRGY